MADEVLARAEVVEDLAPEGEEAAVDPEVGVADVANRLDAVPVPERDDVELVRRPHAEEERRLVARLEGLDHVVERRVGEAVAVGGEEEVVAREVRLDRL